MKKLASRIGLDLLLDKISAYADSQAGRTAVLSLNPTISKEHRLSAFKNLGEIKQVIRLIPSLQILKNERVPEKGKILSGETLLYYKKLLDLSNEIKSMLIDNEALEELENRLDPLAPLVKEITKFIDENGSVIPTSTPALKSFYREKASVENQIEKSLDYFLREKGHLLQDNIITTRLGRTVIPVKYDKKDQIQGIIVDLSRTQNTAFIEPGEIVTLNNRISELEKDIGAEKKRILKYLTDKVTERFDTIEKNAKTLTEIDSLKARTLYAEEFKCIIPDFPESSTLKLKECYHPLLLGEQKKVEPLDLEIGEKERILLISGPNAGGKTVLLKNVGINILSSLAGIPIPAKEGSEIGSFTNIAGIIEDEQSMEESLSSFSSYIVRLKEILRNADNNCLILLDELGGNTDPVEGSALSIALLNALKDNGSLVIATTHLSPLKFYVEEQEGMINGSMEYENGPTYHLQIGIPGGSRAIATAEKFGLPKKLISDAKSFVDSEIFKAETLIEELSLRKRKLREQEKELSRLKRDFSKTKEEYDKKLKNAQEEKKKILHEAKEKAESMVIEARALVERTIKEIQESKASKESIKKYKKTFASLQAKEKKIKTEPIKTSDKSLDIKYHVDLELPFEISVRGMTKEEAWKVADKFLDKAVVANYNSVRIVHGKGSWILRNMLHKKLKKDRRVKSIDTPSHYEGGEGVTVAFLK
ncbi:Smr/MutS family protein [candidate division WOR-3 bacterium]|nr:Smr/MutS family protein [candidate division WOR-3 bacterium]